LPFVKMSMRAYLCAGLLAVTAQAGVIQGVVLEQATGFALARTTVHLDPVPTAGGSLLPPLQTRTGRRGEFSFLSVPDGMYILSATRAEYATTAYGQRRPGGFGTPILITADTTLFADLRMVRKGAISGRVLDENGVGISGVTVMAYRARLPMRQAGSAVSDDRGVYRIHGLDPGKYWIRSAGFTLDDGTGLLPTFGPQSRESRNAVIQEVRVDNETQYADVEPDPGSLFSLGGTVRCAPTPEPGLDGSPPPPVNLTLSSETGRKRIQLFCDQSFRFQDLAPGRYELFGELGKNTLSGFIELGLEKDTDVGAIQLTPSPEVLFVISRAGEGQTSIPVMLTGRRDDLSELEPPQQIKTPRTTLAAGHWDIQGSAAAGQYIESIGTPLTPQQIRAGAEQLPSDAFRVLISNRPGMSVQVVVAEPAATISGSVVSQGKAVPGVPVFLWPVKDETQRQVGGTRQILSNTDGTFRFDALPAGDYRLLATQDVSEVDEEILILANAPTIRAEASETAAAELGLWIAP
jgi:hypothetical protein